MGGVTTLSRLERLEALAQRTKHEVDHAQAKGDPTTQLRQLLAQVEAAIVTERKTSGLVLFPRLATDRVTQRLAELGVDSHAVKVWAHSVGLVDAVKRGRIRGELVEAYAEAHA